MNMELFGVGAGAFLYLAFVIGGVILAISWLFLPWLILSRLRKIHEAILTGTVYVGAKAKEAAIRAQS